MQRIKNALNIISHGAGDSIFIMPTRDARLFFNEITCENVENGYMYETLKLMAEIAEKKAMNRG